MAVRARVWLLTAAVILLNVLGNYTLSLGLRDAERLGASPIDYVKTMADPGVLAGVLLLILWMLFRMALLSWADLSFVLPVTSLGYVLSVAAGAFYMDEQVSTQRWAGAFLIIVGTVLAGSTTPNTSPGK